jgi:hypothetical protein
MENSFPDQTETEPQVEDLIRIISRGETNRRHGALPAEVVKYSPTKQAVSVQPVVAVMVEGEALEIPVFQDVPVRFPSGALGSLTFPLQRGDEGWLRPAGADISGWKVSGSKRAAPTRFTRNSLSDCVFEPGSRPLSRALSSKQVDAVAVVLFAEVLLKLGDSTATDFVALASKVAVELGKISTAIAGVGGAYTPGPVGASKVQAK